MFWHIHRYVLLLLAKGLVQLCASAPRKGDNPSVCLRVLLFFCSERSGGPPGGPAGRREVLLVPPFVFVLSSCRRRLNSGEPPCDRLGAGNACQIFGRAFRLRSSVTGSFRSSVFPFCLFSGFSVCDFSSEKSSTNYAAPGDSPMSYPPFGL